MTSMHYVTQSGIFIENAVLTTTTTATINNNDDDNDSSNSSNDTLPAVQSMCWPLSSGTGQDRIG